MQKSVWTTTVPQTIYLRNHGRRNDFFQGGGKVDFSKRSQKYFSRGAKSGKIRFYPLETKKTSFAKNLIGKCQISNSRGDKALPAPLPTPICATHLE